VRALHQSDRRLDLKRAIAYLIRRGTEHGDQLAALLDRIVDTRIAHHTDKLVATDPSYRIIGPHHRTGTRCNLLEHLVTGAVTEQIVDELEAVKIDIRERPRCVFVALFGDGPLDSAAIQRGG
jgi:hypothetical protein